MLVGFHRLLPFDQSSLVSLLADVPRLEATLHACACASHPVSSALLMRGVRALLYSSQFHCRVACSGAWRLDIGYIANTIESNLDALILVASSTRGARAKLRLRSIIRIMKRSPQLCQVIVKCNERKMLPILLGSYDVWEDLVSYMPSDALGSKSYLEPYVGC